jgi:hypothetical protein
MICVSGSPWWVFSTSGMARWTRLEGLVFSRASRSGCSAGLSTWCPSVATIWEDAHPSTPGPSLVLGPFTLCFRLPHRYVRQAFVPRSRCARWPATWEERLVPAVLGLPEVLRASARPPISTCALPRTRCRRPWLLRSDSAQSPVSDPDRGGKRSHSGRPRHPNWPQSRDRRSGRVRRRHCQVMLGGRLYSLGTLSYGYMNLGFLLPPVVFTVVGVLIGFAYRPTAAHDARVTQPT